MKTLPAGFEESFTSEATLLHGQTPLPPPGRDIVLVVEDDDTVARLMTHILTRVPRRVLRARDGAECARLFREHAAAIALVIMDCRLPDTDGASLCNELRRMSPGLPVLLTSGRDQSRAPALNHGATAFLAKPFLPAQVEHKVSALLAAIN